jgi:hypothetical protein
MKRPTYLPTFSLERSVVADDAVVFVRKGCERCLVAWMEYYSYNQNSRDDLLAKRESVSGHGPTETTER